MGWSDVVQEMVSTFRTEDGASASFASIGARATDLGDTLQNVERVYGTVMRAIGAVQPALMSAIQMGAARQELELTIAGTLRAYNAAGESMDNINRRFHAGTQGWTQAVTAGFDEARRVASATLGQINRDAALLPGSADDYVQGLQVTLPAMLAAAPSRGLRELVDLQNHFIATALVNQIDAPQAGRDLMRLVQGGAGMDVRTWTTLSSLFHNPGRDSWANLRGEALARARAADPEGEHRWRGGNNRAMTAGQFNHLTGDQRVEAVRRALVAYSPLLDRMGNTWGAQMGAFESMISTAQRVIAAPVFEPALRMLGAVNRMLEASMDHIQTIGAYFAGYVGRGIDALIPRVVRLYNTTLAWLQDFVHGPTFRVIFSRLEQVGTAVYRALAPLTGNSTGTMGLISAVLGPLGGAIAGAIGDPRMLKAFNDLADVALRLIPGLTGLVMGTGRLSGMFTEGLIWAVQKFVQVVQLAARLLPDFIGIFTDAITIVAFMLTPLYKGIQLVAGVMGFQGLGDVLHVLIFGVRYLVGAFTVIAMAILMVPLILMSPIIALGVALYKVVKWIYDHTGIGSNPANPALGAATPSTLDDFLRDLHNLMKPGAKTVPDSKSRNANATHPQTHNDFRFSRFDITQKFAEGFDPDRVATAFVTDLQAMAETPLSSGFQPGFSST